MSDNESTFSTLFPESCPLWPVCKKTLQNQDVNGCMKKDTQCPKGQKVVIELLNDILAQLEILNSRG